MTGIAGLLLVKGCWAPAFDRYSWALTSNRWLQGSVGDR